MKYHNYILKKVIDSEVDGGKYYEIYKDGVKITNTWTFENAKEFIDSGCDYNVLG